MRCCTATKKLHSPAGHQAALGTSRGRTARATRRSSLGGAQLGARPTWRPPNEENIKRRAARRAPAISLATSPGALISEAPTNQPAPTAGQWAVDPVGPVGSQWVLWAASGKPVASGSKQQWIQRRQSHTPQRLPTRALMTRSDLRTSSDLDPKALEPRLKGYRGST